MESLVNFHFVEDGSFSGIVQSEEEDASFHVGERIKNAFDDLTHVN